MNSLPNGSVTSPRGFRAAGVRAGLKASGNPDLALIVSDVPAVCAGAFTTNAGAAAPVHYCRRLCEAGAPVRAVVVNSGNANAWTGAQGVADAQAMADAVADRLALSADAVLVCSTGVIGETMPMGVVRKGIAMAAGALSEDGGADAAAAIMTTDTRPKALAVTVEIDGVPVTVGGIAKGSGMIAPRLAPAAPHATMLAYITTDAAIDREVLARVLADSLDQSFNRITVDGDCSTNDTVLVLANGVAGNPRIRDLDSGAGLAFRVAFDHVSAQLARMLVLDGEGASRFVEVTVTGAASRQEAWRCADTIANSLLCKTAWFGGDPNYGRVLDAAGYAGVAMAPARVDLDYGDTPIVRGGRPAGTTHAEQRAAVDRPEISLRLDLGVGTGSFTMWTCDLSYEYVRINAEYHT